jgi:hypothetical protein
LNNKVNLESLNPPPAQRVVRLGYIIHGRLAGKCTPSMRGNLIPPVFNLGHPVGFEKNIPFTCLISAHNLEAGQLFYAGPWSRVRC